MALPPVCGYSTTADCSLPCPLRCVPEQHFHCFSPPPVTNLRTFRLTGSAHGHGHDNPADYVTYAGVTLKKASSGEEFVAHGLGALMWCVCNLSSVITRWERCRAMLCCARTWHGVARYGN